MFQLTKAKLARLVFWWLIVIPSIPFVLITLGVSIYAYWPRDFSSASEFIVAEDTEYLTLSAHGVNDTPASWSDELQQVMATQPYPQLHNVRKQNRSIDWRRYSDNVFICSVAGKKVGIEIGERLASNTNLKALHAIGHSCGSFVVLGICEGAKSINPSLIIQTTYLDPVSVYSGFFWDYGIEHFGTCADFSDNYIDTRDTIPGSNIPLPHLYTFDVTLRQPQEYAAVPPHAWPTRFYINAYQKRSVPILYKSKQNETVQFNKGGSVVLK